ncbi:Structural maintenance of chromosomes protein 2, partial [Dissophora globulifera]
MIEEAAGTRMFEERKEKALKTIAKKEKKVAEITQLLAEEIVPKLDKLRGEKRAYLEFQKTQTEIERLSRIVVSFDYSRFEQRHSKSKDDLEAKVALTERKTTEVQQLQSAISNITENIETITANRLKEMTQGGRFQTLDTTVKDLSKEIVKVKTQRDLKGKEAEEEKQNRVGLQATQKETEKTLQEKRAELNKLQGTYNDLKRKHDEQQEQVRMNEELIQTLSTGLAAEEGHENGYMEQLQRVKASAAQATTFVEQSKLKMKHLETELAEKRKQATAAQKNNKDLSASLSTAKQQVKQLEDALRKQTFDPEKERALQMEKAAEVDAISKLSDQIEHTSRRVSGLDFQYSNPAPNFDRSTVKGLVAELFNVLPENTDAATALEICAGGRLYNVVVDNEVIGSQLLQNGKLRKRVTIIPLNKISAFKAHAQKIATAQKLAPGKVNLALTLIGYEHHLETAMTYIFGNTLICADAESAKKVTFHQEVRMKSVTLDGDVYDPSGTLQGGSRPSGGGILTSLQEIHGLKGQLAEHRTKLQQVENKLASLSKEGRAYAEVKQRLELKSHELRLCEQQISASEHVQLVERVEKLEKEIVQLKAGMEEGNVKKADAVKRCQEIEREMNDFKKNKDGKLQELIQKLAKSKAELVKNAPRVKTMQREYQTLELELEQLEKDLKAATQELTESETHIDNIQQERDRLQTLLTTLEVSLEKAQVEYEREKAQLTAYDEELKELEALLKQKSKLVAESQLEIQNLAHETDRLSKETQQMSKALEDLSAEHEWIQDQKHLFGQPNSQYDFNTQNPSESRKKLKQLDEKHSAMKNKVNPKVMSMLESQEKRETSLKQMLATVQRDKTKIEDTIASLDDYKNEALERTYSKVNGDFGAIFGDLLPGNDAKLQPLEGQGVTGGLEVKVCLGGVWKASLTELSGGQRSLIALSLILSLLQFKPAPMYILDEVDAALDLSHTQNIGQLLRTRFKGSQFIVVSLKEGMFNNANVLFHARFRDGISIVDRNARNQRANTSTTGSGGSGGSKTAAAAAAAAAAARRGGELEKENNVSASNVAASASAAGEGGSGPEKKMAKRIKIQKIPIQHVDGQSVVYWESIERAFPGVTQVKNGDVAIPRCIKSFPGVVLDVVLSSASKHLHVDSSLGAPSVIPTVALAAALTVGLTDALADPSTDLPSEDEHVEGLRVASASADMPSGEIRTHTVSNGYSILPPTSHSAVKATSKTALSFKRVVQLASKREKEYDSQVQMQELRGDMSHMLKLQMASDAKQEEMRLLQQEMKQLQKQAILGQEKIEQLQKQVVHHQTEMKQLQIQSQEELRQMYVEAMGQLAVLQSRVQAVLTQTFELHEYPIPRLFIVLPQDPAGWDAVNPFSNKFRLYFLCECGEHTRLANSETKIPHHIHLAKHEGYEITRPTEFFQQYGPYILTILKMLKLGISVAGVVMPALSQLISPDVMGQSIDSLKQLQDNIIPTVDQVIEWIDKVADSESDTFEYSSVCKGGAVEGPTEQMDTKEALEGADLRKLNTFLQDNDGNKVLGNLYRTVTVEGHVKWVCIDHYRENYQETQAEAFRRALDSVGGSFDENNGLVTAKLRSRVLAEQFYAALGKARSVLELDIDLDFECTKSDLEGLEKALRTS